MLDFVTRSMRSRNLLYVQPSVVFMCALQGSMQMYGWYICMTISPRHSGHRTCDSPITSSSYLFMAKPWCRGMFKPCLAGYWVYLASNRLSHAPAERLSKALDSQPPMGTPLICFKKMLQNLRMRMFMYALTHRIFYYELQVQPYQWGTCVKTLRSQREI